MIRQSNGGFLVGKIKQIQGRVFEKMLAAYGVDAFNGAQGRILFVLWREDGISISALSAQTGLAKTTLTSMLDRLEASGYIRRTPDPADRRATHICLTDAANALRDAYEEVSAQMNSVFYEGFTDAEIRDFEGSLARVLANLVRKEAEK